MSTKKVVIPGKKIFMGSGFKEDGSPKLLLSQADQDKAEAERLKRMKEQEELAKFKKEQEEQENKILFDKQFKDFVEDSSMIRDYDNLSFRQSGVLIRLFIFEQPIETPIIVDETSYKTPTAYAKVLATGPNCVYNPGDIVSISDSLTQWDLNPEYVALVERYKQRPLPPNLPPLESVQQYVSKLREWNRFIYVKSKLYPTDADRITFFVPENYIISVVNG